MAKRGRHEVEEGKLMLPTPLFLPAAIKADLTTEAKRYGMELSPYLRQVIMELLIGAQERNMSLKTYVVWLIMNGVNIAKSE